MGEKKILEIHERYNKIFFHWSQTLLLASLHECNLIFYRLLPKNHKKQLYLVYPSCISKNTAMLFKSPKNYHLYSAYSIASRGVVMFA